MLGTLDGASAEIYGYPFRNRLAGVPFNVYANIFITCRPIRYLGDDWTPAILFDWLVLDRLRAAELLSEAEPRVESSFCLSEHDPVTWWRLAFEHDADGWPKQLTYEIVVDCPGENKDPLPDLRLRGSSPVEFTTIVVTPDNFFPKPSSFAKARALIEPHFPQIAGWTEASDAEGAVVPGARQFRFARPRT